MLKESLENLIKVIENYPNGIGLNDLFLVFAKKIPKRTLQYRLSNLVKKEIVIVRGFGRSTKYFLKEKKEEIEIQKNQITDSKSYSLIPLTTEGIKLQKQIILPLQLRKHVSYQRKFLDNYIPNQTHYLDESLLRKLAKLGDGAEKKLPAGTYARKIYQRLLIDLSWNSSRLEGNTYSLLETERLLATGEEASGKDWIDAQMILNHKDAIEFIVSLSEEISINRYIILNIHALLSNNLLRDPNACGKLRKIPVNIGKSVYHPLEVPQLIEEYFEKILFKAKMIMNPFEQSFFLMVHLPYLQPFLDVNKRVSRLAGNIPFIRENLSPLSFVDVPKSDYIQGLLAIYELNRVELFRDLFVWAYERSASLYIATLEAMGDPDPFRIRYRDYIQKVIFEIVENKMNKFQAANYIAEFASKHISLEDRDYFVNVAEIEARSLHEGNFARFKIRPSPFFEWYKEWK